MKKKVKESVKNILLIFLILLISISYVSALTAKIGNGKVVLNAKVGDVIEKYVKVINSNDVPVVIELFAGGDLKDQFKFKKNNFTLNPYEETNAEYSLLITKEGRTDSQINVKFTPLNGKNGIILPASVIVFASKGNNTINITGWNNQEKTKEEGVKEIESFNENNSKSSDSKRNILIFGIFITFIISLILIVLLIVSKKKFSGENNSGKKIKKAEIKPKK